VSAVLAGAGDAFAGAALSGPLLVAAPVAALAGLVSFASPCVLPLVPGYLGYVTGLTGVELERQRRGRLVAGALLFVLGFSAVFVALGAAFGGLGAFLTRYDRDLARWMGLLVVGMGLVFLGLVPGAGREARVRWRPAAGLVGAPLLGVVFGLGWTPCIGPTLGAVLTLATDAGTAWRGALLALVYCLGLGLPFVLVALGLGRGARGLDALRRHRLLVARLGGGALVVVGLLLVTGVWSSWMSHLQGGIGGFETVL
jgi:cytochrome c-type biogenesis protein